MLKPEKISGKIREKISCPQMSLAIYREVASHLEQNLGVKIELVPQSSSTFAYEDSQIEGLYIDYPPHCDRQQVEAILAYYAERHGTWERSK